MLFVVTRTNKTDDGVFGTLAIESVEFKCVTVENLIKEIPAGIYAVDYMWSDHFQQIMPHILVPDRTAIEIHWANFPVQLAGCIALGTMTELSKDRVDESKIAWIEFIQALAGNMALTIKIIDDYGPA